MTSFADTGQKARDKAERVIIGSVCKVTGIVIVVIISVFSIVQLFRVNLAWSLDMPPDLQNLLCRIDRRCPSNVGEASK
jgi:hypothetical protein